MVWKTVASVAWTPIALTTVVSCGSSGQPPFALGAEAGMSDPSESGSAETAPTSDGVSGDVGGSDMGTSAGSETPEPEGTLGEPAMQSGTDGTLPPEQVSPEYRTGPSPGCSSDALPALSGRGTVSAGGAERSYELHVPPGKTRPQPLLVALHGYTLNAAEHERITGMSELADREGFVVVYPDAIGSPTSWNAGECCSYDDENRDDIGFLSELIDYLGERLCLDQGRVYATGFSNGGMMAYRMACEMADRIAAVASVSGSMVLPRDECHPVRPVPLMHTHGTADPIVPYDGGSGAIWLAPAGETPAQFPSAEGEVELFAGFNGCTTSTETVFSEFDTACIRQPVCTNNAEVMLCTVSGGGHAWPGGAGMGLLTGVITGPQSVTLPTSQVMWDFLKGHQIP